MSADHFRDATKKVAMSAETVAWIFEWGAVSLPHGDPSRITCMSAHQTEAEARAQAEADGMDFDWRVFSVPIPSATLDAAVAAAVAQERELWQQAAETMAQEADQKFPMDGTMAHWLRSLLAKRDLKPEGE